jgi:SAM-dependent methyltransferase
MKAYLSHYPLTVPARMGARRSAEHIRAAARRWFGGRLLDIGSGSRWKADLVGDLVSHYVGMDHAGSIHDLSTVDVLGTAYQIPLGADSIDCVLCTSVIEHLEEPQAALRECLRVLKPGGTAIYTAPAFWHLHEQPRDFYRYTPYGLEHLFRASGFEIVEITPMSGFWMTFASELGYYWLSVAPRLLRPVVTACVVLANLVVPGLDALERRAHRRSREWAWMHIVVARKPGVPAGRTHP